MEDPERKIQNGACIRSSILGLLIFILTLAKSAHAASPTTEPWRPQPGSDAGITILLSPGVAPCVVHVNGLRFPLASGTPLTARYDWDFGDPGGKYNKMTGFNAAHFFQEPGTYAISLTVTDEAGQIQSKAARVVISPDRRHTIFVSPGGSDLNIGTSPESPLHSLGKAMKILPNGCEILLKAGNSFDADSVLKVTRSDVLIGRYGEGPDPTVMLLKQEGNKAPHGFISIDNKCNGVTIEHLIFDSPYAAGENAEAPKIGIDAIVARGRNITVRDCTFLNVDTAVNANGSPMGLLVQDCKSPLKTGLRAYLVWTQGTDFVCVGNTAANSTREHIVRLSGVQRALICDNDFTNLDRRPADKYDTAKGTIEMHNGAYAYIAHNRVRGGTIRVGPLGINEDPSTATDWAVIDSNRVTDTWIMAYAGSHHVMIRNNIIRNDKTQAIQLAGPDNDGRTNGDIHILNNTAIDDGKAGAFLKVWGHVNGIEMRNNLLVAPHLVVGTNGAAVVNLAQDDMSSFTSISNNIWPGFDTPAECLIANKTITLEQWDGFEQVKHDIAATVAVDENGRPSDCKLMIDAGQRLPGVVFDIDGRTRPARPSHRSRGTGTGASNHRIGPQQIAGFAVIFSVVTFQPRLRDRSHHRKGINMSEMNRRDFLLATGVAAVSLMSLPVLQTPAFAAAPPDMPTTPIDAGLLSSFDKDGVTKTFAKKPNYIFLVRKDGKLFACLSMCTHKYRPLTVKEDEFYCPAHHSEFSYEGTVTHGPADNSLPRYAISVDAKGHVMVDCTKEFSEKDWDDAASFVTIK